MLFVWFATSLRTFQSDTKSPLAKQRDRIRFGGQENSERESYGLP